jgi:hypothetical protein
LVSHDIRDAIVEFINGWSAKTGLAMLLSLLWPSRSAEGATGAEPGDVQRAPGAERPRLGELHGGQKPLRWLG